MENDCNGGALMVAMSRRCTEILLWQVTVVWTVRFDRGAVVLQRARGVAHARGAHALRRTRFYTVQRV